MLLKQGSIIRSITYQLAKRLIDEVASPNLKIILDCANLIHTQNHAEQKVIIQGALEQFTGLYLQRFILKTTSWKIERSA